MLSRLVSSLAVLLLMTATAMAIQGLKTGTPTTPTHSASPSNDTSLAATSVHLHRRSLVFRPARRNNRQYPEPRIRDENHIIVDTRRYKSWLSSLAGQPDTSRPILDIQPIGMTVWQALLATNWTRVQVTSATAPDSRMGRLRNAVSRLRSQPSLPIPGWLRCSEGIKPVATRVLWAMHRLVTFMVTVSLSGQLSRSALWRNFKVHSTKGTVFNVGDEICALVTGMPFQNGLVSHYSAGTEDPVLGLITLLAAMLTKITYENLRLVTSNDMFEALFYRRNRLGIGTAIYMPPLNTANTRFLEEQEHALEEDDMHPIRRLASRMLTPSGKLNAKQSLARKAIEAIRDAPGDLSMTSVHNRVMAWACHSLRQMNVTNPLDERFANLAAYDRLLKKLPQFQQALFIRQQLRALRAAEDNTDVLPMVHDGWNMVRAPLEQDLRDQREKVMVNISNTRLGQDLNTDRLANIETMVVLQLDKAMRRGRNRYGNRFRYLTGLVPF